MASPLQDTANMAMGAINTPPKPQMSVGVPNPAMAQGISKTPSPMVKSTSVGIQSKAPIVTPPSNALPANQVKSPSLSFNAGTLAQQHTLNENNKNTAGYVPLKEDGLLGPKTQAAQKQYGSNANTLNNTTGNTTDTSKNSGTPTDTTDYKSLYEKQQADAQKGYQPNDNGLYGKIVTDLGNRSAQSGKDYQDAQAEAKRIQDQQTALSQDYAQKTKNIAGTAGFLTQQNGEQGLLNNQYNTVQNALSGQYAGATSRLGAANTQQGLQQQGLATAAGLSAPQSYSLYNQPYNPVTNTYGGGGANGAIDRSILAGKIGTAGTFSGDYQQGLAKLKTADGIQNQIIATLKSNPTLNNQPITQLTNLNEFLSGQSSQLGQQLLSQQVANYIRTLDLDPASVANIAHQQQGTLAQLLDSLRQTAQTTNEAHNPQNIKNGSSGSSGANDPLGIL